MPTSRTPGPSTAVIALMLTACAAAPELPPAAVLPVGSPGGACSAGSIDAAKALTLRATHRPDGSFLERIDVDRNLARGARWRDAGDWSVLSYALESAGARSLAAHLSALKLPARSEIWWCAPDGRLRHGPYRDAAGGELWTPVVEGERALLEIWVPTPLRERFAGTLADVHGGY
jgi:hypothetical protein